MSNPFRIEMISPLMLRPYQFNSRTHSDEQVEQIAASMREFGWTNPILIDDENRIIAGHGRLQAAEKLEHELVPCVRLSHLDEDQRRAYVIADNKLAENAGWDISMLRLELKDLQDAGFDLALTGFSDEEIDNLLAALDEGGEGGEGEEPPEFTLTIASEDEAEINALRKIFHLNKNRSKIQARDLLAMIPI